MFRRNPEFSAQIQHDLPFRQFFLPGGADQPFQQSAGPDLVPERGDLLEHRSGRIARPVPLDDRTGDEVVPDSRLPQFAQETHAPRNAPILRLAPRRRQIAVPTHRKEKFFVNAEKFRSILPDQLPNRRRLFVSIEELPSMFDSVENLPIDPPVEGDSGDRPGFQSAPQRPLHLGEPGESRRFDGETPRRL